MTTAFINLRSSALEMTILIKRLSRHNGHLTKIQVLILSLMSWNKFLHQFGFQIFALALKKKKKKKKKSIYSQEIILIVVKI